MKYTFSPHAELYLPETRDYHQAIFNARQQVKNGLAVCFSTTHSRETGAAIYLQTAQGWSETPFFQQRNTQE